MTEFWEPWAPRVGQRVRVRLSAECPLPRHHELAGRLVEHYPEQDGLVGTVIGPADWSSREPGHDYLVGLPPIRHGISGGCCAGTFAACELEPIDQEAPPC